MTAVRTRLTLDEAKKLPMEDLIERVYGMIESYEAQPPETPDQLEQRISRTLDELPDVYGWINQLHAWFDHWADFYYSQNKSGLEYKSFREKRDMCEKAASSAKMRYEGASRRVTQLMRHEDEAKMPRGR